MKTYNKYPKYKNSGIPWLGEIPEHWEVRKLKNDSKIKNGATPSTNNPNFWNGDILWITPAEINNITFIGSSNRKITQKGYESCGTNIVPKNSLILTTRAPIGKIVISTKELCTNQGCKSIIPNNINTKFLFYQFKIRTKELNGLGTGTTFMELGNFELKNLLYIAPPKPEQTAIANFLDYKLEKIDRFISKKKQLIELLNEQKAAIINQAVTKGVPPSNGELLMVNGGNNGELLMVNGGNNGELLMVNGGNNGELLMVNGGNNGELLMVNGELENGNSQLTTHNSQFKDSGIEWLGDIPEGWTVKPLKYYTSYNDEALANSTDKDYQLKYIDIGNVNSDGNINEIVEYKFQDAPSRARRIVKNGDVIISTVRTYLKAIAKIEDDTDVIVSTGFVVLRPKSNINSEFLNLLVRANYFIEDVCANSFGVSYPAINASELVTLKLAVPPISEQKAIVQYIETETTKIEKTIATIEKEIALVEEYKTALIAEAVTGKINVLNHDFKD